MTSNFLMDARVEPAHDESEQTALNLKSPPLATECRDLELIGLPGATRAANIQAHLQERT
jgi:hypothetical protein